jgi:hypothetical protein
MKKIALAAAISVISIQASATIYNVSSNITATPQLFLSFVDQVDNSPNGAADFSISGTIEDTNDDGVPENIDITFSGTASFTSGPAVRLDFNLRSTQYIPGQGVVMNGGTILIETDTGNGFTEYSTVEAALDPLEFLSGLGGHLIGLPGQTTAGLKLEGFVPQQTVNNAIDLPGLWDAGFNGTNFNNAVSAVNLFGNQAGLFLEGEIVMVPVPVPAAAWLFGSALLGLVGMGRGRAKC